MVKREIPNVRFVFVGDGELRQSLEKLTGLNLLNDCVHFAGEQKDIRPYLRSFDGFVLTSRWEGLPIVLLEAMASRLPIVATDIPGTRELVIHEENGLLVPCGDHARMADAIVNILSDPERARRMGLRGREMVEESYTEEKMCRKVVDLYLRLLSSKGFETPSSS